MARLSPADLDLALRYAAGRGQIVPRFSPIVRLETGAVAGFVMRPTWQHPDLGAIGPRRVIARATRIGIADDLDRWTIEQACAEIAGWGGEALDALSLVVVPCTAATARDPEAVALARAAADMSGLPAERLVLSWPRRALTAPHIARHHRLGVGVAGAGLASLRDSRLDLVLLGPTSIRRLGTDSTAHQTAQMATRRGVTLLARDPDALSDQSGLANAGITLATDPSTPALSSADAWDVLTASPVPAQA